MEFLDTILSMQNLGNAVVSKGRAILKKRKNKLEVILYIKTLII